MTRFLQSIAVTMLLAFLVSCGSTAGQQYWNVPDPLSLSKRVLTLAPGDLVGAQQQFVTSGPFSRRANAALSYLISPRNSRTFRRPLSYHQRVSIREIKVFGSDLPPFIDISGLNLTISIADGKYVRKLPPLKLSYSPSDNELLRLHNTKPGSSNTYRPHRSSGHVFELTADRHELHELLSMLEEANLTVVIEADLTLAGELATAQLLTVTLSGSWAHVIY